MSFGSGAYQAYIRTHIESGERPPVAWTELTHVSRLAWEAAAQEVARAVIPECFNEEPLDEFDLLSEAFDGDEAEELPSSTDCFEPSDANVCSNAS